MNTKNVFIKGKEKGIEALEIASNTRSNISIEVFRNAINSYHLSESRSINVRGIYQGKLGAASTTSLEADGIDFVIDEVVANAMISETAGKPEIFQGSPKYQHAKIYNKKLKETPIQQKIALLFEIEEKLKKADPRVTEVIQVSYSETEEEYIIENSYGLKLKNHANYCILDAAVKVQEKDSIKVGYEVLLSNDFATLDTASLIKNVVQDALAKLHGKVEWDKKKCFAILNPESAASLIGAYLDSLSAEQVQKKSSFLVGELKKQVASTKLTIEEKPLTKNVFYRNFDDEGVATYNKKLISKGILETYLYNLETAAKDQTTTTANGYRVGNNIGIGSGFIAVKPGRIAEKDLILQTKGEGLYITDIRGLHAGLNAESGNFSLEAEGFMIRDGAIQEPTGIITMAGNLKQLFLDINGIASNAKVLTSGMSVPSIKIKKLSFSA